MKFRHALLPFSLLLTGLAASAQQVPRPAGEFAITLPDGQQTLLSKYGGKVVVLAFISTTCPHCQKTTQFLSTIQTEYGSRGVQVLAAAFNPEAASLVPGFIAQFHPNFPVGSADRDAVLEYEQASLAKPNYVPVLIFIDRSRVIRAQPEHTGGDDFYKDQEKNIRAEIESLLKEPVASAKAAHKARS
ncbi:MAG: TlpA disulfide reductase family protein [Bryobacteraceae bacterium]|jgi:thiol-disulfide isomerase/thioredoxin